MPKKMTKEEFIAKAEARYGKGKYGFDKVVYINNYTKVKILCLSCGKYFWKDPGHFLRGDECSCQKNYKKTPFLTTEEFIKRAEELFGKGRYGYERVNYINNYTPVEIYCPICDEYFWKEPRMFLSGFGCTNCSYREKSESLEEFIRKAKEIHGDLYDYSETVYINRSTKIKIKNIKTGEIFWQTPLSHLSGSDPSKSFSTGEYLVNSILTDLNIDFEKEFSVVNKIKGRTTDRVRIDFEFNYKNKEYWIEYNGEQHYKLVEPFISRSIKNGSRDDMKLYHIQQLQRDKNVRDYCKENGIILIEIPYTYKRYDILKPILEDIIFNGKSPEDLIVSPEIENYKEYLGLD